MYAAEDSRLTQEVRALGGKARRFTCKDGDLRSVEGQRCFSCRAWCSWNALNASRGNVQASRVQQMRQEDVAHLQLCAQVFQWQVDRNRHFHFEQPAQSKMLDSPIISPVVQGSHKVFVDMCAFGLSQAQVSPLRTSVEGLGLRFGVLEGSGDSACRIWFWLRVSELWDLLGVTYFDNMLAVSPCSLQEDTQGSNVRKAQDFVFGVVR